MTQKADAEAAIKGKKQAKRRENKIREQLEAL